MISPPAGGTAVVAEEVPRGAGRPSLPDGAARSWTGLIH